MLLAGEGMIPQSLTDQQLARVKLRLKLRDRYVRGSKSTNPKKVSEKDELLEALILVDCQKSIKGMEHLRHILQIYDDELRHPTSGQEWKPIIER